MTIEDFFKDNKNIVALIQIIAKYDHDYIYGNGYTYGYTHGYVRQFLGDFDFYYKCFEEEEWGINAILKTDNLEYDLKRYLVENRTEYDKEKYKNYQEFLIDFFSNAYHPSLKVKYELIYENILEESFLLMKRCRVEIPSKEDLHLLFESYKKEKAHFSTKSDTFKESAVNQNNKVDNVTLSDSALSGICDVLGNTHEGLSGSEIICLLKGIEITAVSTTYNKRTMLYDSLQAEKDDGKVIKAIASALDPQRYPLNKELHSFLFKNISEILRQDGLEYNKGKIVKLRSLSTKEEGSSETAIPSYLELSENILEYFNKGDYNTTIKNVVQELMDRIVELSGVQKDGEKLIKEVFQKKGDSKLFINSNQPGVEEKETQGFCNLLRAIYQLRNIASHTNKKAREKRLTKEHTGRILHMVSLAHSYLDGAKTNQEEFKKRS